MYIKEFVLYQDEDILVTAENEEDIIDGIFIHTKIDSITPSRLRRFKNIWKELIEALNSAGIKNIYATPLEIKDEKWERVFGFKDTGLRLEGYKLMKLISERSKVGEK